MFHPSTQEADTARSLSPRPAWFTEQGAGRQSSTEKPSRENPEPQKKEAVCSKHFLIEK